MTTPSRTPSDPHGALRAALPTPYLTSDDIAVMFKVPLETVRQWRKKRTGPPGFRVGKYVRYDLAAVRDWTSERMADDDAA